MSEQDSAGTTPEDEQTDGTPEQVPDEAELRAALERELKRLRVEDVLLQTVVSLLNLAGRRAGLAPGSVDERDLGQVHTAIEAVRALMPLVEQSIAPGDLGSLRDALSQLQIAYAKLSSAGGSPSEAPASGAPGETATDPGPAEATGRLWVPGREARPPNR